MNNRVFKAGDSVRISRCVQSSLWVAEDFDTVQGNIYLLDEDDDIDYGDETVRIHADHATFWVPMAALDVVSESTAVAPALTPGRSAAVTPLLSPGRARPAPPQLQRGLAGAQEGGQEGRQATTVPELVPTPAQAPADAPTAPERVVFQEGDVVRVVRRVYGRDQHVTAAQRNAMCDAGYLSSWIPSMDGTLGLPGTVSATEDGYGVEVYIGPEDRTWWYSALSLELVSRRTPDQSDNEPVPVEFQEGDMVRIVRRVRGRGQAGFADSHEDPQSRVTWISAMDATRGMDGRVLHVRRSSTDIQVQVRSSSGSAWWYSPLSLDLVSRQVRTAAVPELVPVERPTTTAAAHAAGAQAASEFCVGDIVRIDRRVSWEEDPEYLNEWHRPGMDPLIGTEGRVTGIEYPGSGVRVYVQGHELYGFSPLSLTRVRGRATGTEASVAAPAPTSPSPRRPTQYLVVGGVCESETTLLLGILDKEPTAYDLLHPDEDAPPEYLRRLCGAAKIEVISGEEEEDYSINLAPYSYVQLGSNLTSSAVLSVPMAGFDEEGSPTPVWENRLWVCVMRVQPEEDGQVDVNLGAMCDNFFTDE